MSANFRRNKKMADIASMLPQILVYGLLLFAALILIYKVRDFLNGKTSCSGCSGGCGCSSSSSEPACCRSGFSAPSNSDKEDDSELNVIRKPR